MIPLRWLKLIFLALLAIFTWFLLVLNFRVSHAETCIASVYSTHDKDQPGTVTASGVPLNDAVPSVAHKTKPLGSHIHVTNRANGKSADLKVTDRGPYVDGRCIDLSRAAAILLGCRGLCPVKND